jgi:hypothetical protein
MASAPLAALLKQIGAETADAGNKIGKINFAVLVQPFFQMHRRDGFDNLFIHSARSGGHSMAINSRLMRKMTGVPIFMWTSDAPPSMAVFKMR